MANNPPADAPNRRRQMAIWQIKEFEEVPMLIDGQPVGYFFGQFFCDADGEVVEIDVRIASGPREGETIRLSEPSVINPVPNPYFRALRAGIEMVYHAELLLLRQEIERATENAHRMEVV